MDKRMSDIDKTNLQNRMKMVYKMYSTALFRGSLVPIHPHNGLTYKSLAVREYKLQDTFWGSTAIFYNGSLIAIVSENGVIYDYVNSFHYSLETLTIIKKHLAELIKALDMQTYPYYLWP